VFLDDELRGIFVIVARSLCLAKVSVAGFIFILDYNPKENDDNWRCVAGLMGKNGYVEEAWDNVKCHAISYALNRTVFIVAS